MRICKDLSAPVREVRFANAGGNYQKGVCEFWGTATLSRGTIQESHIFTTRLCLFVFEEVMLSVRHNLRKTFNE